MKKIRLYFYTVLAVSALSSCASSKKLSYFQNIPENSKPVPVDIADYIEPVIHPDDVLEININTIDPQAAVMINSRNGDARTPSPASGYLVDKEGFVEIPVLGRVKLAGMSTFEAKEYLQQLASEFYRSPVVEVRYTNFRVTVLGEVENPASYVMPNERVSIIDALGYAGDLTVYGKRNNILLIRKNPEGENVAVRMDITDKRILNSPYFYLKQNDIVYVEPSRTRLLNSDNTVPRYLTLAATLVSAYVLLIRYTSLGGN
ncbi:polysaccharide export outer membrane protein [Anseongella ginsenosidimutans]|uniref:Polysaccharide export outer membrane protein n=1 Tax=Anseongella ginsenosidimutans TaxID=496056 RepID=A0A4V2UTX9_9SPHI|nr:polysaccharide biosynthesis/export family protein [Anseongella ginsenosidimutans]QEC53369.1 hypothetical protein FRZ59_14155 [Anseongella ginsenosidimutans]TCS88252.1 polysaccharide export outer membrane protein [Anseongella ginsenosidimutans]